jgi:uncharacterized protein (UPF0276 family)
MAREAPTGIGLGLRAAFLREVVRGDADGKVAFLEVAPENYMHRGGRAPQRFGELAERFSVITHGLMMSLGSPDPLGADYFDELKTFLDRYDPPWHSDHVCFSGLDGVLLHDLLPVPFTSSSARHIADRVREAADRLERPMAVENISWYLELGHKTMDEPEFLTELLERADCGLLLDVNNVFVNAQNHGFDPYDWMARIPLERVWQLHIAGHEPYDETMLLDTHGATVRDEVHELLGWVIERVGPKPVLLERDNNIPELDELLDEVQVLDGVYQRALQRWAARRPKAVADGG